LAAQWLAWPAGNSQCGERFSLFGWLRHTKATKEKVGKPGNGGMEWKEGFFKALHATRREKEIDRVMMMFGQVVLLEKLCMLHVAGHKEVRVIACAGLALPAGWG